MEANYLSVFRQAVNEGYELTEWNSTRMQKIKDEAAEKAAAEAAKKAADEALARGETPPDAGSDAGTVHIAKKNDEEMREIIASKIYSLYSIESGKALKLLFDEVEKLVLSGTPAYEAFNIWLEKLDYAVLTNEKTGERFLQKPSKKDTGKKKGK
jgi:hypothetical protein